MTKNKIVWLIEDNSNEAEQYKRFLEKGGQLRVKPVKPQKYPTLEDYRKLATDQQTGAFLIDQRLEQSGVEYTGIDLVRYLRQIKPELSIYILTGYPRDVMDIGEVEDVIRKSEVRKAPLEYIKRILRSIQRYEEALSDRQKRLDELIQRKLADSLSNQEEAELQNLRQEIERPYGLELIREMNTGHKAFDEMKMFQQISERLSRIEERARSSKTRKRTSPTTAKTRKK